MLDSPYLGRVVVLLTPVLLGISAAIVNAFQDWFGIALDGDELNALLAAAVVAMAGVIYKWLDNRGKYELSEEQVVARKG